MTPSNEGQQSNIRQNAMRRFSPFRFCEITGNHWSKLTSDAKMSKFREKLLSPAIAPDDLATSTFNNVFRSDARKAGLGRVILYSVASGGHNRLPPSLGAQHKRAEKSKIAISNRRCGRARACAQKVYIFLNSALRGLPACRV